MTIRIVAPVALLIAACAAPAAFASHGDGSYDIPNWFQWTGGITSVGGVYQFDVLIIPPDHGQVYNGGGVLGSGTGGGPNEVNPLASSYLHAIRASTLNFKQAIAQYGASWLSSRLSVNIYVVGVDNVPAGALSDPETIIFTDQTKANILGVAFSTNPCLVDNSKFFVTSFTYNDMYNINAQEFGHCLGLEHVVDSHPVHDVLNGLYPYSPGVAANPKNCVSNLDVRGIEATFARLMGRPSTEWGGTRSVPVSGYAQSTCPPGPTDTGLPELPELPDVPEVPDLPVEPPEAPQDNDAGSGGDAPETSQPDVAVQPNVVYEGRMLGTGIDYDDWYAFTGSAGQSVTLRVFGLAQCPGLYSGLAFVDSTCSYDVDGSVVVTGTLTASGTSYLELNTIQPAVYSFGFGFGSAPDVSPVP